MVKCQKGKRGNGSMKKVCLLAFCFFLVLAFICGCDDGTDESSMPVSGSESVAESSTSSGTDSSASKSSEAVSSDASEGGSAAESGDESSVIEESGTKPEESSKDESSTKPEENSKDESSTKPEENSKEESSTKPEENSKEESSTKPEESSKDESSTKPEESSKEESSTKPEESSKEESNTKPEESSKETSSEEPDESSAEDSSEEPDESSEESSVVESSDESSESSSEDQLTYEDTLVRDKDGNYSCKVPYGYTWTVDYVNGQIVGEDVTICTTQAAYQACNPGWSITIYAEKQSDGTYVALRDAIVAPKSAAGAGITIGKNQIAIVVHSAASKPNADYENWKDKVVAKSVRAGDVFEINAAMTSVYAVILKTTDQKPDGGNDEVSGIGDAEFLPTGYLLYNGAAYSQASFSETQSKRYADVYARYAELFPDTDIHVINHPLSVINITNPAVREMTNDQRKVLDQMEACIYGDVNFVNLGEIFEQHRGEYLFFKSDYHWTQLGAYYAYCAFALSMGYEPTPLESFERKIVNNKFIGHTNDYAHDDRILSFYDTVYAYMPIKEHTYAVYHSDLTLYRVFDNCIQMSIDNYSCFLTGDQAYAEINVPENDQDKTVLIIKDSSSNAFVPFLTEHYGNIIIIDPRMYRPDVRVLVEELGVDDIIFFTSASTSNGSTYCNYYREMIRW